jgi:hypothetical protein
MSVETVERLTLMQDLRNAQIARGFAEDRVREYEQAEREWTEENVRMSDVCAHNWQEIHRLNSDMRRVTRARCAVEREQSQERSVALATAAERNALRRELDAANDLIAALDAADSFLLGNRTPPWIEAEMRGASPDVVEGFRRVCLLPPVVHSLQDFHDAFGGAPAKKRGWWADLWYWLRYEVLR